MVERILDWVERNFLKAVALSIFALVLLLCMVVYNVGNATGRASLEKRDYGRSLMPLIQSASRSLSRAALPVPPVEYGGYTPTIYAAPADVGNGSGSSEANAMALATALSTVTAGGIVGLIPGTYTATPVTPSRSNPAWKTTNSGSSGNPIRIVAKYVAANSANSANYSELRSGGVTIGNSSPTFGVSGQSYVEWIGMYVDENVSYSAADTGPVVMWGGSGCRVSYCRIVGDGGIWDAGEMHNGIRVEASGTDRVISYNVISGFEASGTDNNSNHAAIAIDCDLPGDGTVNSGIVEHNEVYDSGAGCFIKKNYGDPGKWVFRYNYVHDCPGAGLRFDSLTDTTANTAHGVDAYQNLIKSCGYAFMLGDSAQPDGGLYYVNIVNNTIVSCGSVLLTVTLDTNASHLFHNNIVASCTRGFDFYAVDGNIVAAALDTEHNDYYSISGTFAETGLS